MKQIIERLRLTGAIIVGGFAIHGALVACGAGSDPTPVARANPTDGNGNGGAGAGSGASGIKIELNAKDEGIETEAGDVVLTGRGGLPADATAVYLQIRVPDSSGRCGDAWTVGGKGVASARLIGEDEHPVAYHQIWVPLDSSQTLTIGGTETEDCYGRVKVQVLGWLTP
jgi:hypothetical protein